MTTRDHQTARRAMLFAALLAVASAAPVLAQAKDEKPTLEIYGFAMADAIVDFKVNNPDWYDVNRPSKLPSFPGEFGNDQHFYLSPRQSKLGVKATLPTSNGDIKVVIDFDMFGVGRNVGTTMFRLQNAYGQWKQIGAGQTYSQFMDADVFPNILEYWGPNGMLYFRNVQVFWQPYKEGESNLTVAIEAPGASADLGLLSERNELQNVKGRFPAPDFTGHYRFGTKRGYIQFGAAVRYIAWDDLIPNDRFDLNGHVWGWGTSLSSNVKLRTSNVLRLQLVYGRGIENYFNDAPVDVGVERNPGSTVTPVEGEALPIFGLVTYLDHNWSSKWTTAVGYSMVNVNNSDLQAASSFNVGRYASVNLLCTPVKNVLAGVEFQWGQRKAVNDFKSDDYRLQFSFKYSFNAKVTGE